jgi:hypothetical protein
MPLCHCSKCCRDRAFPARYVGIDRAIIRLSEQPVMPRFLLRTLFAACLLSASACSKSYIPNTDVPDTDENRRLIEFCEKYRHAMERQSIPELLKLADKTYYEDRGDMDASNDTDFAGLKGFLTEKFRDAKSIRYEIRYRRVVHEEERIFIDYTFSASFRIPGPDGDDWYRKVDDNRLELVETNDGQYSIVAGM